MTSHNNPDPTTLRRLTARVRRLVERSSQNDASTREVLTNLARADPLAVTSAPAETPPALAESLSMPPGRPRLVTLTTCGARVRAMVVPRGHADPDRDRLLWGWLRGFVLLHLASRTGDVENVALFPLREELPDEFAALSIDDESGKRLLAVNTRQSHDSAKASLRKLGPAAVVPIAGILPDRVATAFRQRPGVSLLVATGITSSLLFGGVALMSQDKPVPPPVAMQVDPPAQATVTVTTAPRPKETSGERTPARPPATRSADPAPTRPASTTRKPSPPLSLPSPSRSLPRPPEAEQDPPGPSATPVPQSHAPTSDPTPTQPPPSTPPDSPPARPAPTGEKDEDCDGILRVEIDPLLDVCLLG